MLSAWQTDDWGYRVLLLLHILTAIVGLGAVMLNGLYVAQAQKRGGPAGRAVSEANFAVSMIAEKAIYLIPIFGILLVLVNDAWDWDQTWVWLALLLFVVALGISHAVLIPSHRKFNELLAEIEQAPPSAGGPPPQADAIETLGKKMAASGAMLNVLVVVILTLMIWKPGL